MSVIVAIKESGVVYMGADSQTTTGRRKRNDLICSLFHCR